MVLCWAGLVRPGSRVCVAKMFSSSICVASRLRDTETLLASRETYPSQSGSLLLGLAVSRTVHHEVPGPGPGIKY